MKIKLSEKFELYNIYVPYVNTNCYLLSQDKDSVLVDAGGDGNLIIDYLKKNDLNLKTILITHGHYDHIEALDNLCDTFKDASVYANEEEKVVIENQNNSLMDHDLKKEVLDRINYIEDGYVIETLGTKVKMISTPGHTTGCCCYYIEELKVLFSGDTMFKDTYGRVDLPTSNPKEIVLSFSNKIMKLPDEVAVYPGHGFSTTIGHEREHSELLKDYVINWAINN